MMMKLAALALLTATLFAGHANAAPISAIDLTAVGSSTFNYSGTLGWSFKAKSDMNVGALGQWDFQDNGLSSSSWVGIWDASNNLLASVTVGTGTAGTLIGHYRYADISDITLQAGKTYTIGSTFSGSVMLSSYAGYSFTPAAQLSEVKGAWNSSPKTALTSFVGSSAIYGGANFLITNEVPEPGSLALIGLGILGAAVARCRKAG
ncbi:hypothetical protein ASF77_14985 [Massilia sp. Leaf139]|nr:hypothetical protein ASF77_14985 [Massilia sp. Leaf139]